MSHAQAVLAIILAVAVVIGSARLLHLQRTVPQSRPILALRLLLQPLLALALHLALFPPLREAADDATLVVLTARWQEAGATGARDTARRIALPEAGEVAGIDQAADLASALRRHPQVTHIQLIGDGLVARDRSSAQGRTLQLSPAALPTGVSEIDVPPSLLPGQAFALPGRVHGADTGVVTLLDPAGHVLDRAAVGSDGRFVLHTIARGSGPALLALQVTDGSGALVESIAVPMIVDEADRPRMLLLSGSPSPELKYLRRWAVDAGIELTSRVQLTERIEQRRGAAGLDAATLQAFDLAVIDDRSWFALAAAERDTLLDAVHAGLGLLLRLTNDPDPQQRDALQSLGFQVDVTDTTRSVELEGATGHSGDAASVAPARDTTPLDSGAARETSAVSTATAAARPIALNRRPLDVHAPGATPLLNAANGDALALWQPSGHGRIALWWLSDSFRLVLAGAEPMHGSLWSKAVTTLARPRTGADYTVFPATPRSGSRVILCGIDAGTQVAAPDGSATPLLVDSASSCAAYWPATAGLHKLADDQGSPPRWFHVHARDEPPAMAALELQQASARIAEAKPHQSADSPTHHRHSMSAWPFSLTWLALFALTGWLERRR
jgi:hypothetical protein